MNLDNLCYVTFALWGIGETALGFFKRASMDPALKDTSSLSQKIIINGALLIGISFTVWSRIAGFHLFDFPGKHALWQLPGLFLLIVGISIRWNAISTLGRFFSINLTIQENHTIIERGLYKHLRHPSYTGSILSFLGFGLSMTTWPSLFFLTIIPLGTFIHRISVEEAMLEKKFGEQYKEYRNRTKKLIPFLF
jgi:protein-S-isoprenylcysteine O-methyltransferase Ste14